MVEIKGYKVFNPDWTCRDKQCACPGIFEEDVNPDVCNCGMHFCKNAADCFNYYSFDSENKVAEVVALGDVMEDGDKCATNKLQIVREVSWAELLSIINTGKDLQDVATPATATPATGTKHAFQMVVLIQKNRKFTCLISRQNGLIEIG